MKPLAVAVIGILAFGAFLYWLFKPSEKTNLASQVASAQSRSQEQGKGHTSSESEKVYAVDYTLEAFDGQRVTLSEVNKDKPVVIQIWATWCEVCAREFPDNNKIAQKYKDQIEYHAVNIGGSDQTPKSIESYVKRMKLDPDAIKFLVDMKATVSGYYGFNSTPQHLFIVRGGAIKYYKPGYMSPNEMESQIQALLQN